MFNSIDEIKAAVNCGEVVYVNSKAYQVIKDRLGQYLIKCLLNDYCVGLTWRITAEDYKEKYGKEIGKFNHVERNGEVLNGKLENFFKSE